jgi:hypothetical protein
LRKMSHVYTILSTPVDVKVQTVYEPLVALVPLVPVMVSPDAAAVR